MGEVQGSPSPPWSDLPSELLGLVFLRLPTRADRAFFHAVCRTWCSAARHCRLPPPSPVPWLVLPDGSATSFPRGETFQLPTGMRHHNSYGEWLLLSRNDGSCLLMNQFTKATMPLPSLSSHSYYQEPVGGNEDYLVPEVRGTWLDNKDKDEILVTSLVVCSTRLIAAIVAIRSYMRVHEVCRFSDMVFLQGKIYALDRSAMPMPGYLIAIDIVDEYDSEPRVSRIECVIEGISFPLQEKFFWVPYLLEFHGTLLMVCKKLSYKIEHQSGNFSIIFVAGGSGFVVFEANLERHLWAEMKTLGNDQALFLGRGCSRAVHVSPYDLSRDCIFFLDDFTGYWKKTTTACELYDMKDEKIYSPLPMVSRKSGKVPAIWIFSPDECDRIC
ncbi:hypothetical protein SORBI_3005G015100 [Sorghum bicolor]|uniref:DUF295 domain-containing protein n=1 Tax=Sorghum bicolor TaxID=4558 RepID=A0A1Z5RG78_SORBI|nr:hypothetical protein SORBI_3005G015100 [Sorghum bicolor]